LVKIREELKQNKRPQVAIIEKKNSYNKKVVTSKETSAETGSWAITPGIKVKMCKKAQQQKSGRKWGSG